MSLHEERRARDFLARHGMLFADIDRKRELDRLLAEMDSVRGGASGSVKMIPAYIGPFRAPGREETVTVIDIGGTNVRAARAAVTPEGEIRFGPVTAYLTPGVEEETDTAGFFAEIVRGCRDTLGTAGTGLCFSLATVPGKDRDAVMVAGGKQIRVTDMLGKKVGASFRAAAAALGAPDPGTITVTNDTVAAALGGAAGEGPGAGPEIGFIYGTGTNLCYREPTGELINVESGAYTGFPTGDIDDLYDSGLIDTGQDRFEKMVSGGYQGGLAGVVLETAAGEGILPGASLTALKAGGPLTAKDISAFSFAPRGDGRIASAFPDASSRRFLEDLFALLTRRSARLCAVTLTAAMLRSGAGKGTAARITAEGSTYHKQKDFAAFLDEELAGFAGREFGLAWAIRSVDRAVFRGIAASCFSE